MTRRNFVWLLAATLTFLLCWHRVHSAPEEQYKEFFDLFADTLQHVETSHVQPPPRQKLVEAALEGITKRLDRYSSYISQKELELFRDQMRQEFGGIGIQVELSEGQLMVHTPLPRSPAYQAGVQAGDRIVAIEGKPTTDLPVEERLTAAVGKLKGAPGTNVTMSVLHEGADQPQEITITRAVIHVDTIKGGAYNADGGWDFLIDKENKVGFVRLQEFHDDTADELESALNTLREQGMRSLILDLRFDPGGLLSSAVKVCDLFISKGRIVSTQARNASEVAYDARAPGTFEGFPMVVLINRYSASASEIVAACLQDHKRAVLVGERTWGKGSVQNVIDLGPGRGAMKLTTASYQRPSGQNIHRFDDAKESDPWGVQPDEGFHVLLADPQALEGKSNSEKTRLEWQAMEQYTRDRYRRDVLLRPGAAPPTTEFVDRQLQRALEHLRSQLKSQPASQNQTASSPGSSGGKGL